MEYLVELPVYLYPCSLFLLFNNVSSIKSIYKLSSIYTLFIWFFLVHKYENSANITSPEEEVYHTLLGKGQYAIYLYFKNKITSFIFERV